MAQYDVYLGENNALWLDVQSDLVSDLNTRIIVPLLPANTAPKPARRLNPIFEIKGKSYVCVPQFLSAIPVSQLSNVVSNLSVNRDDITAALDMVFQGFDVAIEPFLDLLLSK